MGTGLAPPRFGLGEVLAAHTHNVNGNSRIISRYRFLLLRT